MKRLALVAVLLAASGAARAQTVLHEENRFRSPQHWAVELRFGPYLPEIDSEFPGAAAPPYQTYFGDKKKLMLQFEVDYQFTHAFGSAAIGLQAGYFNRGGWAKDLKGEPSADRTRLLVVPLSLQLVYRLDEGARHLGIPLVPYAKVGLGYWLWRITDANGDTAQGTAGQTGKGATPGWQAAAGLALLLDWIDPGSARALDSDTGVNHTYLFGEITRYEISGLGRKKSLHLGDSTWVVGLMFEF